MTCHDIIRFHQKQGRLTAVNVRDGQRSGEASEPGGIAILIQNGSLTSKAYQGALRVSLT